MCGTCRPSSVEHGRTGVPGVVPGGYPGWSMDGYTRRAMYTGPYGPYMALEPDIDSILYLESIGSWPTSQSEDLRLRYLRSEILRSEI